MRILIISDDPRSNTGYGKLTSAWAKHLQKKGHEVLILGGVSPNSQVSFQEIDFEGIRLWLVPGYGHQEHIRHFLTHEKPDVVLANSDPRFFDFLFKMDNEIRRQCPLVFYHLWDDLPFPDYNMPYYLSCDRIICGSEFTYDILSNHTELTTKCDISYAPIGIDLDTYKPLSVEEKKVFRDEFNNFSQHKYDKAKFIVGVVTRNTERKQLLGIVDSFYHWAKDKDDVVLFIHTPGGDENNSIGYALDSLYSDSKIIYSKAAPQMQTNELINKFYNLFSVLVNRSSAEGFGLPIAEAMAAGIPCISVDTVGPAALIDSDTGWLLEADCKPLFSNIVTPYIQMRYVSDNKFKTALDDAYYNIADRLVKASKCRSFIEQNYNSKDMCQMLEDQIQEAINNWVAYPSYTLTSWPSLEATFKGEVK